MTTSEAITHIMHDHITGIREDAARIRTQVRASKGLEVKRAKEIAARLDQIDMRLDELAAFVLPDRSAAGPTLQRQPGS